MSDQSARTWIWTAILLQFLGYVFDAAWHGFLSPGVEPRTVDEMIRHLTTVHLPLYVGAASVLVATGMVLVRGIRGSGGGTAPRVAFAGALLSTGAEAWHAASHLELDTHTAPVAGILSVVGFAVVVAAMTLDGRTRRRRVSDARGQRRAA
jgi:hypothetical protein